MGHDHLSPCLLFLSNNPLISLIAPDTSAPPDNHCTFRSSLAHSPLPLLSSILLEHSHLLYHKACLPSDKCPSATANPLGNDVPIAPTYHGSSSNLPCLAFHIVHDVVALGLKHGETGCILRQRKYRWSIYMYNHNHLPGGHHLLCHACSVMRLINQRHGRCCAVPFLRSHKALDQQR